MRRRRRARAVIALVGIVSTLTACSGSAGKAAQVAPVMPAPSAVTTSPTSVASTAPPTKRVPRRRASTSPGMSLRGQVIGIDPGHNGGNYGSPSFINRPVWNGREMEACDTTGTETNGGYTEALFTFNVARYLAADLRAKGARVVLTRSTNSGVGPCIDRRASLLNEAHSDVAIDIHADGGPAGGRGFAILEPVDDTTNHAALAGSYRFGSLLRQTLLADTSLPTSSYDGTNGIAYRNDLAGLNLTTVPKVLIECGNMRNSQDAALLVSPAFQRRLAAAFTASIETFLSRS